MRTEGTKLEAIAESSCEQHNSNLFPSKRGIYNCNITMIAWLVTALFGVFWLWWRKETQRPPNYPPGPNWLPIVGNSPLLRKLAIAMKGQHWVFERWMKEYNSPVIGLRLGGENVVVAMTYPMVRAIHTGDEFVGRPDNFFLRLRTMGTKLGITCTDGELWTEQRNFTVRQLRQAGYGRKPMDVQIQDELLELFDVVDKTDGLPVWPATMLPPSVLNVLWVFAAGERIPRDDVRLTRLITLLQQRSKAFDMSGGVLNQMPWLRHLAPERTGFNLINRFNKEIHAFLMTAIDEHKANYAEDKATDDLIYAFITEMRRTEGTATTFTDYQLTMTILDLFIAGAQATAISVDLALMTIATYPRLQTRIHAELDQLNGRMPTYADRKQMPFTEAVMIEVQRYYHIMPVTGPRRALHDTELGGYHIPKNTTILIGLGTVHMDREYWGDPEVFRPERFLDANMQIVNKERVMPFGQGKRKCLGEMLARSTMFTFFAGLMQRYSVDLPYDAEKPDRNLLPAITLAPRPYKVMFTRR